MTKLRKEIAKQLIDIEAVSLQPNDPFTWASGIKSPIYCDNRLTLSYPKVRKEIAKGLQHLIKTYFANAEVIIAPHGSGLTNIAFCRPETIVVELVSPHYIRHYYWVISRLLGLHHYFLVGDEITCAPVRELMYQNPLTEDIWVNLNSLKTMLERLNLDHSTLAS